MNEGGESARSAGDPVVPSVVAVEVHFQRPKPFPDLVAVSVLDSRPNPREFLRAEKFISLRYLSTRIREIRMSYQKKEQLSPTAQRTGRLSPTTLIRGAGLSAVLAGILYIGIQVIHPTDTLSSVNSDIWLTVAGLTIAMAILSLIGITGIYASQVTESGWLGLVGYAVFGLFWLTTVAFSFMEAFILPLLTTTAPGFVEGSLGLFTGVQSEVDLGLLSTVAIMAGAMYLVGGFLFGLATYRAEVLPRLAGALLAFGAVVTLASAVIPHPADRILAVPMGLAFIWLGYSLWSRTREGSGVN